MTNRVTLTYTFTAEVTIRDIKASSVDAAEELVEEKLKSVLELCAHCAGWGDDYTLCIHADEPSLAGAIDSDTGKDLEI